MYVPTYTLVRYRKDEVPKFQIRTSSGFFNETNVSCAWKVY